MTKIEQEYADAMQAEAEALKRKVQAADAVNSAARLLLQAENALLLATKDHVAAMEQAKVAAEALVAETSARRDAMRIAAAFPAPGGVQ